MTAFFLLLQWNLRQVLWNVLPFINKKNTLLIVSIIVTSLQPFNYKDLHNNKNPELFKYINLSCMHLETYNSRWCDRVFNFFFLLPALHIPSLTGHLRCLVVPLKGGAKGSIRRNPPWVIPMHLVMISSKSGGWWKLTFLLKDIPMGSLKAPLGLFA